MFGLFVKKYISIIFIVATFMGVFHHHNDFASHNDCQICTIQNSVSNADTPTEAHYLTKIDIYPQEITSPLPVFHSRSPYTTLNARAPPYHS